MATSVQYGIRHLMALTLVVAVAVVAAILGPTVRAWDTERQTFFAANAAITVAALAASILISCRVRLRVERNAGFLFIAPLLTRFWWGLSMGSVEICQQGLIVGGSRFHPFDRIKHYRLSHYTPGSLVFVANHTTWAVKIPSESRDDVDRLLKSHGVRRVGGETGNTRQ